MTASRPITLLISALGGEGGGVLSGWIAAAADAQGFPVQTTSIPGVAQRTGGTTYYIEILPVPQSELGGRKPVLALTPGIGDIDIMLASEFLEAGRAVSAGFVTPDRTLMIASTSRFYVMDEKIAMGDGRYNQSRLSGAIDSYARAKLLFDMEAIAKQSGAMINAVMLGALAGCGELPIPVEAFEAAIQHDGKAIEANLRGFRAGLAVAQQAMQSPQKYVDGKRRAPALRGHQRLEKLEQAAAAMPKLARHVVTEGVRRLAAYQDWKYARLYLDRLHPILEIDQRAASGGRLLREVARHLAVRMSFEDVVRVAQAKIDPARMVRIIGELGVTAEQPYRVVEFLKPGIDEFCQLLPPQVARPILHLAKQYPWLNYLNWGMEVQTTSISGYLRFWLLAKLRVARPYMHRYAQEQSAIKYWLHQINDAAKFSPPLAFEIAECARLIKGYGDTHKRGVANYRLITEKIIHPALHHQILPQHAVDAVASARTAALLDPEGESLARCLDALQQQSDYRIAAE
jgi:indolepyruvate ferredoxin oxidoreductase beta subunit